VETVSIVNGTLPAAASAPAQHKKVTLGAKVSFGLGLAALNLVLTIISTYLLYFYTDVVGLKASSVGTMFLLSRLFGCAAYLVLGGLIDRTHTRWGKSRPWFLWTSAPLAVIAVLTVLTPHFPGAWNLVYAYVTYNLLILTLSICSLALGAVVPAMTADLRERSQLGATGAFFGIGGLLGVSYATLPLVKLLGAGDEATGFRFTVMLYGFLTFVFLLITFSYVREQVKPIRPGTIPLPERLASARKNTPWHILMLAMTLFWVVVIMHTQTTVYYLKYNVHRPDLVPLVMATLVGALPGTLCCVAASDRIGKRNAMVGACVIAVLGLLLIAVGGPAAIVPLVVGNLVFSFGKGLVIGLFIAMIPDTVDFGEWKTTVWAPGIIYAGMALAQNVGMGIGGALSSWLLSAGKYVANAEQTASALRAIELTYIWVPMAALGAMVLAWVLYRLDTHLKVLKDDLDARRTASQQG
jgi:GPH family glycoside/pentoside/hexuronide:cation symporter